MLVHAAAAKMSAGRAEITFARAAEILGGRVKRTDAMLLIVEARRVTTFLALGVSVVGDTIALLMASMDAHARAKEDKEVVGDPSALVVGSATPAAAINGMFLT